MMPEQAPDELAAREVTIKRHLLAAPDVVWAAWTQPWQFARWFGTPPFSTPASTVGMDLKVGGQWHATQVSSDGETELPFVGVYRELDEPSRLVFTFENPGDRSDPNVELVTVTLERAADGTDMTLHQVGHMPADQYPLLAEGYSQFFDRLEQHLATP